MTANKEPRGSFILPSAEKMGSFRCGVCWSFTLAVQVAVEEHRVIVRLVCTECGNTAEWEVENGS